ncbi:hypothetical protein DESC_180055 [Desulfosarcina cetonica]|nr:hypothetical protein DESC_180055 [Desulfosarcina cetonica]
MPHCSESRCRRSRLNQLEPLTRRGTEDETDWQVSRMGGCLTGLDRLFEWQFQSGASSGNGIDIACRFGSGHGFRILAGPETGADRGVWKRRFRRL